MHPQTAQSGLSPYHLYSIDTTNDNDISNNDKLFTKGLHQSRLSDRLEDSLSILSQSFSSDMSDFHDTRDRSTSVDSESWNPRFSPSTTSTSLTVNTTGVDNEFRIPPFPLEAFSQDHEAYDNRILEGSFPVLQISCDHGRQAIPASPLSPHATGHGSKRRQHVRNTYVLDGSQADVFESLATAAASQSRISDERRSRNRAFSSSEFEELLSDMSSTTISSSSAKAYL